MKDLKSVIELGTLNDMETFLELLNVLGTGNNVSSTSYDSAWIARLKHISPVLGNHALGWLCDHQLPDGSWGAEFPFYYHDRIISTLSAMIALTYGGRRHRDKLQIEKGLEALEQITSNATQRLRADLNGAPAGFEMIVPTLVAEAEKLGIIKRQGERILGKLARQRELKMQKMQGVGRVNRYITAAYSAEMTGADKLDLLDAENLQETNGSVACSPAATAHFAIYVKPGDQNALDYLAPIVNSRFGGAPNFSPLEIYERTWCLWNLSLTNLFWEDTEVARACTVHLDYLEQHWRPGIGLSFSRNYSVQDLDDTSVACEVLLRFGRQPEGNVIFQYEEEEWFRCFQYEVFPSCDVNIHVLGALRQAGIDKSHPGVQKALKFIHSKRNNQYWLDRWNLSPYYSTAHMIISARGYDDDRLEESVKWMLDTQRSDGAWGFFNDRATAEETAYCIQALAIWQKHTGKSFSARIKHAGNWLSQHCEPPYPPLWLAKSLHCMEVLVKSCILSALILVDETN